MAMKFEVVRKNVRKIFFLRFCSSVVGGLKEVFQAVKNNDLDLLDVIKRSAK